MRGRPINFDAQYAKLETIYRRAVTNLPKLVAEKGYFESDYLLTSALSDEGFYGDLQDALDQLRSTSRSSEEYNTLLYAYRAKLRQAELLSSPQRVKRMAGLGLAAELEYLKKLETIPTFNKTQRQNLEMLKQQFREMTPVERAKFLTGKKYQDPLTLTTKSPYRNAQRNLSEKALGKGGFLTMRAGIK